MANSITFQFIDTQMQSFERLLDEFNTTMKRIEGNQPQRQERMAKLKAEIELLLSQANEEVKRIREYVLANLKCFGRAKCGKSFLTDLKIYLLSALKLKGMKKKLIV